MVRLSRWMLLIAAALASVILLTAAEEAVAAKKRCVVGWSKTSRREMPPNRPIALPVLVSVVSRANNHVGPLIIAR